VAVSAVRRFVTLLTDLDRDAGLDRGYAALDGLDSAKRRCFDQAWLSFGREAARAEGGAPGDARSKTVVQAAVLRGARTLATEWLAKDAKAPAMDAAEREAAKLRERWRALAAIVRRLGVLAEKELQGAAFTEDDAKFLHGYALTLAFPMLYDGNIAGMAPPDVPGAVSVFTLIEPGKEPRSLHAAWGMPCAIYVLWPAATGDVLCRGAVVPYREFVRGNRVTDDEWGAMLRSPPAPPAPEWMAPIAVPVRPEKK
jgi:hypothetical protein